MTKMATMPIYGKNHKKLLLRNQLADVVATWYTASGSFYYQVCSNDDPSLIFDLFTQRSSLVPYSSLYKLNICMGKGLNGGLLRNYLRNTCRSALAGNCWVIIHCLEISCKGDQITNAKRE